MKRKKKTRRDRIKAPKPHKVVRRNPKARPHRYYKIGETTRMSKKRKKEISYHNDWMAVKALRKFVRGFGPENGYNLNAVYEGKLPSAMKAKIRRYRDRYMPEIIAINNSHAVVKTYRNRDTLGPAVEASQQFAPMGKDQRAAVFATKYPDEFTVRLKRSKGQKFFDLNDGVETLRRMPFKAAEFQGELDAWYGEPVDMYQVLADDPGVIAEIAQILMPGARQYAVMTGKYSTVPIAADEFGEYFANWMLQYTDEDGEFLIDIENFLMGIEARY